MTCREKFIDQFGHAADDMYNYCPSEFNYMSPPEYCTENVNYEQCKKCWNREIPEEKSEAVPCESNPEVLHKSGPVPYGEKAIPDPCYVNVQEVADNMVVEEANAIPRDEIKAVIDESDKWICNDCEHLRHSTTDKEFAGLPFCRLFGAYCETLTQCECYSKKSQTPNELRESMGLPRVEDKNYIIKDSGARREFETGAVRDIQEGKGRCDLLPLDVLSNWTSVEFSDMCDQIAAFQDTGDYKCLIPCIDIFTSYVNDGELYSNKIYHIFLEVSKHFEDGAKKYGEYNWQKGIPTHCYIDSAVRHYLKYLRGDKDEPHDRAFVWNVLCCIWTCIHKPELNDYKKG